MHAPSDERLLRTLAGFVSHPNVAAALVADCGGLPAEAVLEAASSFRGKPDFTKLVHLQGDLDRLCVITSRVRTKGSTKRRL